MIVTDIIDLDRVKEIIEKKRDELLRRVVVGLRPIGIVAPFTAGKTMTMKPIRESFKTSLISYLEKIGKNTRYKLSLR